MKRLFIKCKIFNVKIFWLLKYFLMKLYKNEEKYYHIKKTFSKNNFKIYYSGNNKIYK